MQQWTEHFKEQFGAIAAEEWQAKVRVKKGITKYKEDRGIKVESIRKIIRKMKKRKGPGEDGIPNEAWMHGEEELINDLNEIINKIWEEEREVPEEWKCGIVTPIYKKRENKIAKKYRGITLMDTAYKIYAEILRNRLEDEMEKKKMLEDTQTGYRKETGTIDAIYMVKTAVEEEIKKEKGEVYILFADMVEPLTK